MNTYDAEVSVLGSILIEGPLFAQLEINEEYFVYEQHRIIFQAMQQAYEERQAIDLVLVTAMLGEKVKAAGGVTYLTKIAESVPSTATFKQYEQILKDAYLVRQAKQAVQHFLKNPSEQKLDRLLEELQDCREASLRTEEKNTYDHLLEISEELLDPSDPISGYLTSYPDFDRLTGGLQRGDVIIIAARPSVGKTAFALNLAAGHCRNGGKSILFSLEMGTKQLLKRMISAEGNIHASKWRDIPNRFTTKDYERAIHAIGTMTDWELEIFDTKRTIAEIRAEIRNQLHKHPNQKTLVIIDYLQLIMPSVIRRDRRDLEIGEITRELKLLAMELQIPIVLLSQLSRGVDARQEKRPVMSDLRESGNIEQDADMIAFLYREDYYDRQAAKRNELEIIIAKQRNGPTGTVKMKFLKEYGLVKEENGD